MKNILIISGKKQTGKNSLAAFLTGYMMKRNQEDSGLEDYRVDEGTNGELYVPVKEFGDDYDLGKEDHSKAYHVGPLDIFRCDARFKEWAADHIWPYARCYNFAEPLKNIAVNIFGLKYESVWGTDEQKNQYTHIKFESIKKFAPPEYDHRKGGYVTGREFLEILGTDIFRHIYNDCWVNFCYNQILGSNSKLNIIFDARFPNELEFFKEQAKENIELNVKVIRLNKKVADSKAKSEIALDDYEGFDYVMPNKEDLTMHEKHVLVIDKLMEWGMIEVEV